MASYRTVTKLGKGFQGVHTIFEYVNEDSKITNMCGQAACATLLTYLGFRPAITETLTKIVKSHPSDLLGGNGTAPWGIQGILEDNGAKFHAYPGDANDLKLRVKQMQPVICVIQNTPGFKGLKDGSHWFVVFAYNDDGVFVSNYPNNFLKWSEFNGLWNSPISNIASIYFKAITETSRVQQSNVLMA